MLPWLYLHFPSLQLDALTQDAQTTAEAIIVIDPKHHLVCQLNQAAAEYGIRLNMGLATAISLAADLNIVEYKVETAQSRLHELAQWLYQVVADIVLFEPDGLALKVTNMLALYGSIDNYWGKVSPLLNEQQVHYQGAMGKTVTQARLLARSTRQPLTLNEQITQQRLEQLPVSLLELPGKQIEQLQRVGIQQLHQLLSLDSKALGRRFGLEVLNYLSTIKGYHCVPLKEYHPPEHYSKYLELLHEISQSQTLLFPLQRMVREMSAFLAKRAQEITELNITLHYRDKERHADTHILIGSAAGEYHFDKWMALVNLKIERTELEAPVTAITLSTGQTVKVNAIAGSLFSDNQAQMTPGQLVSLLQAKVGKAHISGLELLADHRPEHAFAYNSSNPLNSDARSPQQLSAQQKLPNPRPLVLLTTPEPVKEKYQILQGPERIRSAWWSKEPVYRDYFIARNQDGAVCWLYNEPCGTWYLQGYFC